MVSLSPIMTPSAGAPAHAPAHAATSTNTANILRDISSLWRLKLKFDYIVAMISLLSLYFFFFSSFLLLLLNVAKDKIEFSYFLSLGFICLERPIDKVLMMSALSICLYIQSNWEQVHCSRTPWRHDSFQILNNTYINNNKTAWITQVY